MKSLIKHNNPMLANKDECTGCMACVNICAQKAIETYIGEDGHRYVKVYKERCIGCNACEKVCKKSRKYYGSDDLDASKVYVSWTLENEDRKNATSGGVFAALARIVIKNNGVVIGAYLDGRECKHVLISKMEDIKMLQGSKYMTSDITDIYGKIEKMLPDRTVLFSGVGCQCAGILAYFENHKFKDNLITLDLICGGIPSKILLDKFYDQYPDVDKIMSFRTKDKYELKVFENNNIKTIKEKSLPLHGFNCELTNRMNCYHCQFACAHRKTDITIGDFWNYDYMPEEHSKGISTLIIHTGKGKNIIEEANLFLKRIEWSECLIKCKRIVWGESPLFSPRKKLTYYTKNLNYEQFRKLYCMDIKPLDFVDFLFRIYRYYVMRLNSLRASRYIKKLLKKF